MPKATPVKKVTAETFKRGDYLAQEHGGLPLGGKRGQVIRKKSAANFDADWFDEMEKATELPVFDAGLNIATGKHPGYSIVNKFGRRVNLNLSALPQDVWDRGGVYSGFPVTDFNEPIEPMEFEVFSTNDSDKGQIVIQYLENRFSEAYKVAPVQLNGTVPVSTGAFGIRLHTARYNNDSPAKLNLGEIIIRHRQAPQNVFCAMPVGRSQTACAAITVPYNHTGFVRRIFAWMSGNTETQLDGGLWIRDRGESPRIRRPFTCSQSSPFSELPFGGIPVLQGGDIMIRISESLFPATGIRVGAGFDIVFVKNTDERIKKMLDACLTDGD